MDKRWLKHYNINLSGEVYSWTEIDPMEQYTEIQHYVIIPL